MSKSTSKTDRFATFNHITDEVVQEMQLSAADYGVWAYFWRHGNPDGFIDLSNSKIKRDLNIKSDHTLRKHIRKLIDSGLITIVRKGTKDRSPTRYKYSRIEKQ